MSIYCPYCDSTHVSRAMQPTASEQHNTSSFSSAASFATIGASLSKTVPLGISPLFGGIAGAVVGSVLGGVFSDPQPKRQARPVQCFQCDDCGHYFY